MNFELYTVGVRFKQNENRAIPYVLLLDGLLIPQSIKTVIDLRAINNFTKYTEDYKYNPINLHQLLKEKGINYYNLGDLYRTIHLSWKNLSDRNEKLTVGDSSFNRLLDVFKIIGSNDGNVCLLFPSQYTLVQRHPQKLSMRGSFSKAMFRLHPDLKLYHYVPYKVGRTIYTNRELCCDSYGEINTIRADMEDRARERSRPYTYDSDEDDSPTYSSQDLDDMYRDAYDGNPEARWNTD